jgi:small subunit ribosomal protein S20
MICVQAYTFTEGGVIGGVMPVIKSAKKRLKTSTRKRVVNLKTTRLLKSALKSFAAKPTQQSLNQAYSALDTASKKGAIPKGRADRKKGRLALFLSKKSQVKHSPSKTAKNKSKPRISKRPSQK